MCESIDRAPVGRMGLFAAVFGAGLMISDARGQQADRPGAESKAPAAAIGQARALVAELEAQVERQRAEVRRSEANLVQARALLAQLEDSPKRAPQTYPQNGRRSHTLEDRRRLSDQSVAEKAQWTWSDETATAEACARQLRGGYEATITPSTGGFLTATITITHDGRTVASWKGHRYSTFVIAHDVLYRTDFSPTSTGCDAIAYDLKQGQTIWTTHLWGVRVDAHSMYSNRVRLDVDDLYVIVFGNESAGRYIELLDPKTGKTVGQRLLGRPGYGS